MQTPANNDSYYYSYKGTFSIAFIAIVDGKYKFMYDDVCCDGKI
jgi:hypothetical protein